MEEATSSYIDSQLMELGAVINSYRDDNGEYKFDLTKAAVALDFAISEIKKAAELNG